MDVGLLIDKDGLDLDLPRLAKYGPITVTCLGYTSGKADMLVIQVERNIVRSPSLSFLPSIIWNRGYRS